MLDKTTKPPCLFKLTWNAKHGLPLMKERKKEKKKAVHLIYQIRQESKILSMLLLLRRPKQEAINWRQRKWLQVSKPGKIPSFSPPPGTSLGGSCPSTPSHTQLNAIRTSNFQIHTMKGVGKEDCKQDCRTRWRHAKEKKPNRKRAHGSFSEQAPHHVQRREEYLRLALRLCTAFFFTVGFERQGQFGFTRRHHICKTHRC